MSKDREAARALNTLARDGFALLGSSDSSALTDFLQDYFGGDDPGNESPGMSEQKVCATPYPMPYR